MPRNRTRSGARRAGTAAGGTRPGTLTQMPPMDPLAPIPGQAVSHRWRAGSRTLVAMLWLTLPLGVPAGVVHGATVPVYSATLPVASRAEDERASAVRTGLRHVLIKVTGRRDAPAVPGVQGLFRDPSALVRDFQYRELREPPPAPDSDVAAGPPDAGLELHVTFEAQAINRALAAADLPLWGPQRPKLLLWLALQVGSERRLVGASEAGSLDRLIDTASARRGLPLALPVLDLQERAAVEYSDVWGGFVERLADFQTRYGANGALLVRASATDPNGPYSLRFSLHLPGLAAAEWDSAAATLGEALVDGIEQGADRVALHYAVTAATPPRPMRIQVTGISGLRDYVAVLDYLSALWLLSEVQPQLVEADRVTFRVEMRGDPETLLTVVGLEPVLVADGLATDAADRLSFQYQPAR